MVSRKWKGKALLDKIELISFFVIYTIVILIPVFISSTSKDKRGSVVGSLFLWVGIFLLIYILIFISVQQYVLRTISDKYNGKWIITGWADQEEDKGEEFEFIVEKMTPFTKLSQGEVESIRRYIEEEKVKLQMFTKVGIQDLLPYRDDNTKLLNNKPEDDK